VEIALWTVGVTIISGVAQGGGWRRILNGPAIAILSAAALHFAGARSWMPTVALSAIHSLGATAIPLGILLTGATFADHMRDLSTGSRGLTTFGACVLRLGLLPILMLALARWLPCPIELRRVIVIQAAMPCGMIPVILAKHYGGDPAAALRIVLYTSALGLLTIPFWLQLGLRCIGAS
jgi:hypothetical protein